MKHRKAPGVISGSLAALAAANAAAQCQPEWSGIAGGADWEVRGLAAVDEDGDGPLGEALFAGGGFSELGGIESFIIARWDGWEASTVGAGLSADQFGLAHLSVAPAGHPLIGPGLIAAGELDFAGGIPVNQIARWLSPDWHDVGGGVESEHPNIWPYVFDTYAFFDEDGDGPKKPSLYVGGKFAFAGVEPAQSLARWDGQAWTPINGLGYGDDQRPTVHALAVYDDGRGPAMYAAGSFYYADEDYALNIARWDGSTWESVGIGLNATVETLCVYDEDGDGPNPPALFAGGQFSHAPDIPTNRIARWDGQEWSAVGNFQPPGAVRALVVWKGPDDEKENLYAGGLFNTMPDGSPVNKIARWDGQSWRKVGTGVTGFGQGTSISAMAVFDEDGDGPNPGGLYIGGLFYYAGDVETHHIARWGCPLAPRCEPDLDESGILDLFDFLDFLNYFNAEAFRADCAADGQYDLFDFLCYVNQFNEGCP